MKKTKVPKEYDPQDYSCYECDSCKIKNQLGKNNQVTKFYYCRHFKQKLKYFKSCEFFKLKTKREPSYFDALAIFLTAGSLILLNFGLGYSYKHNWKYLSIVVVIGIALFGISIVGITMIKEYIITLRPKVKKIKKK